MSLLFFKYDMLLSCLVCCSLIIVYFVLYIINILLFIIQIATEFEEFSFIFLFLQAHMKFPPDYPYSPPSIRFLTKVWHPNVYEVSTKNRILHKH